MRPRLTMMMKRPVTFPDIDIRGIMAEGCISTVAGAWRACGEAMLEGNEPCMEMSESAGEIAAAIGIMGGGLEVKRLARTRYGIHDGSGKLLLDESPDGTISVIFGQGEMIDVTDYGPEDVARFVLALFSQYKKITSESIHS